jgi:long-chain acyl-CoA synthetase
MDRTLESGRAVDTVVPGGTVADLLRTAAAEEPQRIAVGEAATGRAVSWEVLDDLVDRVATGLSRLGLVAGYRVMIAMPNRIEFVAAYLGVLRAGMVAVPVNPRSTTGELVRVLADSGSRVVFVDETTAPTVRAAVAGVAEAIRATSEATGAAAGAVRPEVVAAGTPTEPGEHAWDALVAEPGTPPALRDDPEALAVLLYTSGTSGRPRGAMLSHRALRANIEQVAQVDPPMVVGQDVVLGVLPLFHVYGLNAVLGQVLRQHARLVLVDGFDPEGSLDLIEDEAISVLPVAPPVFAYWMQVPSLEERLGPVRLVLSGSAPLSPELTRAFTARTGLTVHQGYGLTEAAPVVTSTLCSTHADERSVGAALPGIELRLVDELGRPPESEDGGEIHVRGANLFSGYWPDGADGPDADGWYPTGDVGYLTAAGDLYLVDRVKDLVIVSGFNVYPSEVEDVITELAEVAEAAVIGVEDALTGEAVVAYVKPESHVDPDGLVDLVREQCARRLARFKQPGRVHVVDQLPHTPTGKVQKGRLRATERRRALGLLEG